MHGRTKEVMAASLGEFAEKICKDPLDRGKFEKRFQRFLKKVDLPDDWEESSGYELQDDLPTYKHRYNCLRKLVEQTVEETEAPIMTVDQLEPFIKKIENAAHSSLETEKSFSSVQEQENRPFDLFEKHIAIKGVVVRKCEKKLKASILTKKQDNDKTLLNELVINIQDASKSGGGFQLNEGDVVEVTKCKRKEGVAFDAQLIKCFSHTGSEMQAFLDHVVNCLQFEGTTAVVTKLTRCQASWDYILKNCNDEMAPQILDIIDKICSSAQTQMSDPARRIVVGLERSVFFKSVLPSFIHSMAKENYNRVQKVLEHVIKVSPESGPTLLPMATDLAHSLVGNSSDEQTATAKDLHVGCHSAIEFLAKLSSIIAVKVPGACEDLTALQWRELPLIPVTTELHEARVRTDHLPKIKVKGNYQSEEEYLDTHFRLLREECFYKLRKGISGFVENSCSPFDPKDMMMYRIVLTAVSTHDDNSPTAMSIALKYTVEHSKTDADEWDLSRWFMFGDLLCISLDNSFQEPIWGTVEKHVKEDSTVWIILCNEANVINEAEFIMKMQDVTDRNEQAFMAESQTFYTSYAPAMDVLQHKDCVPFKEFLVYPEKNSTNMKPADYINEIKQQPDWEIIFKKEHLPDHSHHEEDEPYSLLEEFNQLKGHCKSELDDTQLEAVELALRNKLALIQGPPGTGKSFVGVALVRFLLSMKVPQNHGPILVITYKNFALDHFLEECLTKVSSHDVRIVRVGRLAEGASEELKKCLLREVGGAWPKQRYEEKRTLTGKLWAMQSRVREAFVKLRESSVFNAEMFLNEASRDQIKYLLVDDEHRTVDGAEVERLLDQQDHSRLKEFVKKALKDWLLPTQKEFDSFAREEENPPEENGEASLDTKGTPAKSQMSSTSRGKQKNKEDQEQENPNDLRDPAVEQIERLLAVDEELVDEEDKEIMKNEAPVPQEYRETIDELCTRKLISIDETKVKHFRNLLSASKVWELKKDERIKLAYVFQSSHREKACKEFLDVSQAYMQIHQELEELKKQRNIEVMRTCDVIGMTVTGATIRANLLADIKPSVMIVEEAAEILEGQLVAVIPPSVQHLIMIGDHKQLKPLVHFHRLKKHHNLDLSMFERLVNCNLLYKQLKFQCRMRDEFADLLRRLQIYDELNTKEERVCKNVVPQCVEKSMFFWTHTERESDSKNSHSKLNKTEAKKITEVAETFCREGEVLPSEITVLCSYRGQVAEIQNRFMRSEVTELRNISVATIDSFQGRENDIILISLVRSSESGKIGHLSSPNRLCVAISRARRGLYLFGNHAQLSKASKKGWKKVADAMRENSCLGSRFPFRSRNQFKSQGEAEDQNEGRSLGREPGPINIEKLIVVNATQANVISAGDNSRNTITSTPANSASGTRPSVDLEIPRFPRSDKIPVHDPKSPTPTVGCPPLRMEGGGSSVDTSPSVVGRQVAGREGYGADIEHAVESTEEARMSTQESHETKKSSPGSSVGVEQRPVQVSQDPKTRNTVTMLTEEEIMAGDKEARQPIPETSEAEKPSLDSSEIQQAKERPVQESEDPKNRTTVTTVTEEEIVASDKEARPPTQETSEAEKPSPDSREIQQAKERPVQESEDPKNRTTVTTVTEEEIVASDKEARPPTQETSEAEKPSPDSREIQQAKERPVQESEDPKNRTTVTTVTEEEIVASDKEARPPTQETSEAEKPSPDSREIQQAKERPVQESMDPKNRITVTTVTEEETMAGDKEARPPTQETSEAEKPSPDSREIQQAKERPVQESEDPKNRITVTTVTEEEIVASDKEARKPTQASSEAEKSSVDVSEVENMKEKPIQESENPKSSTVDAPTMEDELTKKAPVQESEEPTARKDEVKYHPERGVRQVFEERDLKDSASTDVRTKSYQEEAVPSQETMPVGKGPFEETGLEVGVKGQQSDYQE